MLSTIAAVALLGAIPGAAAADWRSGTYTGTTSQGKTLQLDVTQRRVNITFFGYVAPPCGGAGGVQFAGVKARIGSTGRFKYQEPYYGGFIKGRLQGRRVEGTAAYYFSNATTSCDSGIVTWTGKRVSG
ncbi:MAG: hypothetical protein ACR2G3_10635 [Solirubrobacterales bacterium]